MDLASIMLSEIESTKQKSKQNITRDIEIKNKWTTTRGERGGYNGEKTRKGHQGTCIKDTWTKPKGDKIKGEKWGWLG